MASTIKTGWAAEKLIVDTFLPGYDDIVGTSAIRPKFGVFSQSAMGDRPSNLIIDLSARFDERDKPKVKMTFTVEIPIEEDTLKGYAERWAKMFGHAINRHDYSMFAGYTVVPDMSAHTWLDPEDGITKRAGGTPKYLKQRKGADMLKGMSDLECKVWDSMKDRHPRRDDGGYWTMDEIDNGGMNMADQLARITKEEDDRKNALRLTKEAAAREFEARIAEEERQEALKTKAKSDFYTDQTDYGLF